jgi:hypothetical protein
LLLDSLSKELVRFEDKTLHWLLILIRRIVAKHIEVISISSIFEIDSIVSNVEVMTLFLFNFILSWIVNKSSIVIDIESIRSLCYTSVDVVPIEDELVFEDGITHFFSWYILAVFNELVIEVIRR